MTAFNFGRKRFMTELLKYLFVILVVFCWIVILKRYMYSNLQGYTGRIVQFLLSIKWTGVHHFQPTPYQITFTVDQVYY